MVGQQGKAIHIKSRHHSFFYERISDSKMHAFQSAETEFMLNGFCKSMVKLSRYFEWSGIKTQLMQLNPGSMERLNGFSLNRFLQSFINGN